MSRRLLSSFVFAWPRGLAVSAAPSGFWVELLAAQLFAVLCLLRHPLVHLNSDCGVFILYGVNLSIVVHFHGASDAASDGASLW